jgi:hypothetical protein
MIRIRSGSVSSGGYSRALSPVYIDGVIEIAERFWPYQRTCDSEPATDLAGYIGEVKRRFLERRCARSIFTAADQQLAADTLVFYRAADEGIRHPSDVVDLLNAEGIETGTLRARNPITHDQWWIPVVDLAKAGTPYVIALAAVVRTWLKERKGRQVRLENGRSKITASTVADAERPSRVPRLPIPRLRKWKRGL